MEGMKKIRRNKKDDERKDGGERQVKRRRKDRGRERLQQDRVRQVADGQEGNKDNRAAQKGVMTLIPRFAPQREGQH